MIPNAEQWFVVMRELAKATEYNVPDPWLLSGRIVADSTTPWSETSDGTMRPLNSREAA